MELLEDCRNGVALTGTMIENTEDEGCTTVFWLKAYLYRKKGKQVMRHDVEIAGEKYINNKKNYAFLRNEGWFTENDKAWFVASDGHALIQMDMKVGQCDFLGEIPALPTEFRMEARCIKCGNDVYCIPYNADIIWVYGLESLQFTSIEIANLYKIETVMLNAWKYGEKIFIVSNGLKQILELSTSEKKIDNYYNLSTLSDAETVQNIRVGSSIYCVSEVQNQILQFDMAAKQVTVHMFSGINDRLCTICFDGEKFWLGGYKKAIYVWDERDNSVKIIDKFPRNFGIYDFEGKKEKMLDCQSVIYHVPAFYAIMAAGRYIWYIPYQTNKIVYVDKDTYEVSSLEIEEEEETEISLKRVYLKHKYVLEYIQDDRYIGLYSFKNNCCLEIDTIEKKIEKKTYTFSESCLQKLMRLYDKYDITLFHEQDGISELLFGMKIISKAAENNIRIYESVGERIKKEMIDS